MDLFNEIIEDKQRGEIGLPYMGNKKAILPFIYKTIYTRNPEMTDFYDLFGGSGAVSFYFKQFTNANVHYNEYNPAVYNLIKFFTDGNKMPADWWNWVSREEYKSSLDKTDPKSAMIQICWGFGNKIGAYMFGKDKEELKRLGHYVAYFKDAEAAKKLNELLNTNEIKVYNDTDNITRRLKLYADIKRIKDYNNRFELQQLERLEQLQQLEQLERLQVSNLSYEKVIIKGKNPVIYCDPPYNNTASYKIKGKEGFNHDEFYKWFAGLPYPAFMSEYNAPFESIAEIKKTSLLCNTGAKKFITEKIFWNGK
jgi:site-specific DNA-adenine methylase